MEAVTWTDIKLAVKDVNDTPDISAITDDKVQMVRRYFEEGLAQYSTLKWRANISTVVAFVAIPAAVTSLLIRSPMMTYHYKVARHVHSVSTVLLSLGITALFAALYHHLKLMDRHTAFKDALNFRQPKQAKPDGIEAVQQPEPLNKLGDVIKGGFNPLKYSQVFEPGSALCCAIEKKNRYAAAMMLLFYETVEDRRKAAMEAMAFVKDDSSFELLIPYARAADVETATAALSTALRGSHRFAIQKIVENFSYVDKKRAVETSLDLTAKAFQLRSILGKLGVVMDEQCESVSQLRDLCIAAKIGTAKDPLSDAFLKKIFEALGA